MNASEHAKTPTKRYLTRRRRRETMRAEATCSCFVRFNVRSKTNQEDEEDIAREIVGKRGAAKRISDMRSKPKVICTCASPIKRAGRFDQHHSVTYCDRCKLVISEEEKENDN